MALLAFGLVSTRVHLVPVLGRNTPLNSEKNI